MAWFERQYYILKTPSGDAIGVVRPVVNSSVGTPMFALQIPKYEDTSDEFMDLNPIASNLPEIETHRDAFETMEELEIVDIQEHNMSAYILVRKKEKPAE